MSEITIEWLHDEYDCDTCGWDFASGARVYRDGELLVEMVPHAHCFDGSTYDDREVFKRTLEALGHRLVTSDD